MMNNLNETAKNALQQLGEKNFFREGLQDNNFKVLYEAHLALGKETLCTSLILSANAHVWGGLYPILKFGTERHKNQFLPQLLSAKIISGHAITEPLVGSDVDNMFSTAQKTEGGYLLNGHKRYITNAPIADWLIVYLKTEDGMTAFLVKKDDPGASFITKNNLQAFKNSTIGDVILENCWVPTDRIVGQIGSGKMIMQHTLEHERVFIFAGILGIMEQHFSKIISHTRTRKYGTGYLGNIQTIRHMLANMQIRIETIKRWLEHCVHLKQNNKRITLPSSQIKVYASEAFVAFCEDAIQIMGASGLLTEAVWSDLLTDAMACRLLSGSNEIQKNIIAALIGGV